MVPTVSLTIAAISKSNSYRTYFTYGLFIGPNMGCVIMCTDTRAHSKLMCTAVCKNLIDCTGVWTFIILFHHHCKTVVL